MSNYNFSKIKSLSDSQISDIMMKILLGQHIVQKGRKFKNEGEDPRSIPEYKEIFDDYKTSLEYELPALHIMEVINLEIQFEAENRGKAKREYFSEINVQTRVDGFLNTSRQNEIQSEIYGS